MAPPTVVPVSLRYPVRQCACGNPPRLRVPDHACHPTSGLDAQLRKLCRLARAGGSAKNDDGIEADSLDDLASMRRDGQSRVVFELKRGRLLLWGA